MPATDTAKELARTAAQAASDRLATDITAIDVADNLVLTDAFVIASTSNERQVHAVVDNIEEQLLRRHQIKPIRREGTGENRWVLVDFGDITVHVFHEDDREYYGLDKLWGDCATLELPELESQNAQ